VTNPPYMGLGGMNAKLSEYLKNNYPDNRNDICACFVHKWFERLQTQGIESMITMESWMFLSSFHNMRHHINKNKTMINMAHMPYLGKGGTSLGINFGTAITVIGNSLIDGYNGTYSRIAYYETDAEGVPCHFPVKNEYFKHTSQNKFLMIPGNPIAYWASDDLAGLFCNPAIDGYVVFRQGMATSDNNRFLRIWFEVSHNKICFAAHDLSSAKESKCKWFPYNKGGAYRKWFGNTDYVVNWENDGAEMKAYTSTLPQGMNVRLKSREYYFKPCYSWSKVTSGQIAFRYYPQGFAFDVAGCCVFDCGDRLSYFLALSNSVVTKKIIECLSPTMNYELDQLKRIPVIFSDNAEKLVNELVSKNIDLCYLDWNSFETSWGFKKHPLV